MESPYNRPVAANLIGQGIEDHRKLFSNGLYCGWSQEMFIYNYLKQAGYLTENAMVPADDEPAPKSEPAKLCCDRQNWYDPCN